MATIYGGGGNDTINGDNPTLSGTFNDLLFGNNGDDLIYGFTANDTVYGGNGAPSRLYLAS